MPPNDLESNNQARFQQKFRSSYSRLTELSFWKVVLYSFISLTLYSIGTVIDAEDIGEHLNHAMSLTSVSVSALTLSLIDPSPESNVEVHRFLLVAAAILSSYAWFGFFTLSRYFRARQDKCIDFKDFKTALCVHVFCQVCTRASLGFIIAAVVLWARAERALTAITTKGVLGLIVIISIGTAPIFAYRK